MKHFGKRLKNIFWLCRPYRKYARVYFFVILLTSALLEPIDDFFYVYFPKEIVDLLAVGKSFWYVAIFSAIVCGILFIKNMTPKVLYPYFQRKSKEVELKIKRDIYKKALSIDYRYIDNPEYYNKYAWAITEYSAQTLAARDFMSKFIQHFMSVTMLFTMIAAIGPWIIPIEIIQMFLHCKIDFIKNKMNIAYKQKLVPVKRRLSYFQRLFYQSEYAADIKSTLVGKKIMDKYDITENENLDIVKRYSKKQALYSILHETTFALTEFIIICYIVYNITVGNIAEVGLYIMMTLAFYRGDSKLRELIDLITGADELSLNAEKLREFFDIESKIESSISGKSILEKTAFSVELKDVSFAYENSAFSLSHINLSIKPGEKIAIVGENGAGKSTLVKLLLRFYDVTQGEILINGNRISEYNIKELRKRIGVAFQKPLVYAMTLEENISLYGDVPISDIDAICEKLGLLSIFQKSGADRGTELTKEFDSEGIMLSGGEIQKIALARIMSGKFGLLILDEPSSALDPISEYKMNELILGEANKTTTIMIAHRLSTVRDADKIVLVENGTIQEYGTHDELIELKGRYYEMFTKQAENYLE